MKSPKAIPISEAEAFATKNDLRQVIIFGFDSNRVTHVMSWGDTVEYSDQAAEGANRIKRGWGWPPDTIVESEKVLALRAQITELEEMYLKVQPA